MNRRQKAGLFFGMMIVVALAIAFSAWHGMAQTANPKANSGGRITLEDAYSARGKSMKPPAGGGVVGRYAIYYSPTMRADTFLLDTASGQVWQMVKDSKADETIWERMKKE